MAPEFKLVRIPSLKTVGEFRNHLASLGVELPCDDAVVAGADSPLAAALDGVVINGRRIGNRIAVQPMEGWDGTTTGAPKEETIRRWQRFGESGAKLIYGGEAMAVRPDGRANPHQLILNDDNLAAIAKLNEVLRSAHREKYGNEDDLVVGFQLTHSGRFCRPNDKQRIEPRVAFRHPLLDKKFSVTSDAQVFTDGEVEQLILDYVAAAARAAKAGADFVDIKHCHGYLLHEFLGAHTRPGKYGGSFENRTRILREIVAGIRAAGLKLDIGVRLSAFDFVPFRPDQEKSVPGKLGPGIPEEYAHCLPYRYGFGVDANDPLKYDLRETHAFAQLCGELGVKILNLSAGSPYYNPHIQRPAAYPPSDGYQPDHDPLINLARQMRVTREIKSAAPKGLAIVGSAYTYLQEYLPHVAQAAVRLGWVDVVGLGRMMLSYPSLLTDAVANGSIASRMICRTFSDCTTAPRNGLISGCYPLDKYYADKPEAKLVKEIKKRI